MKMPNSNQLFRYSYITVISFLMGLFIGMNFLPNGRTNQYIASLNSDIIRQQKMIDEILKETNKDKSMDSISTFVNNDSFEKLSLLTNFDLKTVNSNGLSIDIPKNWNVEEINTLNSSIQTGLIVMSPDLVESAKTENLIGDEQTIVSGVKMHLYYQPEEVAVTIEDSIDYFNFISKYISNNSKSRSVIIAGIPMLLSKNSYSGNFLSETNDEWAMLQGRYAGKKIQIQIFYKGLYSDKQELLDGILASIKFVN